MGKIMGNSSWKSIGLLAIGILLFGCSGGGGGGGITQTSPETGDDSDPVITNPTSPTALFPTFPEGYFVKGYKETFTVLGSDSDGFRYSGTITFQTPFDREGFDGTKQVGVRIWNDFQITETTTNQMANWGGSEFFSTDPAARQLLGEIECYDNGINLIEYVSVTNASIPQFVKIGDSGLVGKYYTIDGSSETISYSVTDAGNGYVNLTYSYEFKDSNGVSDGSEVHTFVIDQNGNRISLKIRAIDKGGSTLKISGNKTFSGPAVPTYSISGRLTFDDGMTPVVGALVVIEYLDSTGSDENGTYSFTGLTSGTYTIICYDIPGFEFSPKVKTITINDTNVADLNFVARASSKPLNTMSFSGTVTTNKDVPLQGVTLTLSTNKKWEQVSDASGNYSFNSIPSGYYNIITPSLEGYVFIPTREALASGASYVNCNFTAIKE